MANSSNLVFCLEYSNHLTDMMDAFDDYLRNETMVDVMLSCEGNTIKAHKMVLSAGSTYFRNIFAAFKNPFQFPVLIIKDMPFRDLKAIVEFLYRGEVIVPVEQVSSLTKSAQTLFIKGLEKYFNTSAVVNVANNSKNCSGNQSTKVSTQPNRGDNSVKRSQTNTKSKTKQTVNESARCVGMSLRKTPRPDYRQLSNGDINSDGDNSDTELQNQFTSTGVRKQTNVSPGRRHSGHSGPLSRRIKSEIINSENLETNDHKLIPYENMDHTGDGEGDDTSIISEEDNQRKGISMSDKNEGNSNKWCSSSTTTNPGPIKGDPDNMELIHCSHCPRVFSQTSSLNIHMKRVHSDQNKEHICKLCGKKYSWRSGLYKHMRTHRNS